MDNDTRWGSVMDIVEYALENRVHLEMYCRDVDELEEDHLTEQVSPIGYGLRKGDCM